MPGLIYTTDDELDFLVRLGRNGIPHSVSKITRVQLLESYIKNINLRKDWGLVDAQRVYEAAVKMLALEREANHV